jgi:hypothetical protein
LIAIEQIGSLGNNAIKNAIQDGLVRSMPEDEDFSQIDAAGLDQHIERQRCCGD